MIIIKLTNAVERGVLMRQQLEPGLTFEFEYIVPIEKTVPFLLPESAEFQLMPEVLATGFMVGLIEWACIQAVNPYLDWPRQQTVGTAVNLTHTAATPPGLTVTVKGTLEKIDGRKLSFSIKACDGIDTISEGVHERYIIDAERFNAKTRLKLAESRSQ
jgi:fluoroacetyl-CoA thioesterase